jgi:uncharacterized repeat protein (TIGR03806 family)
LKTAKEISVALILIALLVGCTREAPHGLASRIPTKPFLGMPARADGNIPLLLSQTGVFSDTAKLIPNAGIIPYDLIVAFWSDGADKSRLMAVPNGTIAFSPTGEWRFPSGTVFAKTFRLGDRRLETRVLVRDAGGGVYGVVYKWRADGSDADLLTDGQTEDIAESVNGEVRRQTWYFPSRQDCLSCHTALAGGVLGVKTRQMNRMFKYPSGIIDNQLRAWNNIGLFSPRFPDSDVTKFPALAALNDASQPIEQRARSYLDANCSQCHRPGGTVANFDARFDTPLGAQALIDGPVLIDQGIDRPRVISPHDRWRSIVYMRVNTVGDIKMPPLARETVDQNGVQLLRQWIDGMPGRAVLPPPVISPAGGTFDRPIEVSLTTSEPGVDIRYTLDGSVPGIRDRHYEQPIKLTGAAVVRARSFKEGFTRSIAQQEVFIVGK